MRHKVLIATEKPFARIATEGILEIFTNAGYETVLLEKYTTRDEFLAKVGDVEALIVRSDIVDRDLIAAAKNLKIVVRAGAGYDNIDLAAATEKGVVVMNTPGQNANAVAELVFGLMLNLVRKGYSGQSGTELRGKTLGLHGFGNVSRFVARIASGFGMKTLAFDPYIKAEVISNEGVEPVATVQELYRRSQFVSLHIPKTKETVKSINYDLLNLLPAEGILINTARAEIIDEPSLLRMFEERKLFMYGADVMPECAEEIRQKYAGRFFFTAKKMGAQTEEANINAGLAAARQIVAFFENGDCTYQVNK